MGMYTRLNISVTFKKDMPKDVRKIIESIMDTTLSQESRSSIQTLYGTSHEIFSNNLWTYGIFAGDAYFHGPGHKLVTEDFQGSLQISFSSSIKNYNYEWEYFLEFIAPYVETYDTETYIGTYMYEEDDTPTLVYILPRGVYSFRTIDTYKDIR